MEGWLGYTVLGKCLGGFAGGTCSSSIERVDATQYRPNVGGGGLVYKVRHANSLVAYHIQGE
jgi:hypothetical protein